MIYQKELVHYRKTNFLHPNGLQTFATVTLKKEQKFQRMLQQSKFCGNSIHGVYYLWESDTRRSTRMFWALTVIVAIIACFVMYEIVSNHHNKQQIKTVVETSQLPIYTINFPAVAICPWNHVNWLRFKAAERRFLPKSANDELKQSFYDLLVSLEDMSLSRIGSLQVLEKYKTIPRAINNINLFDLVNFMAFRCDELFTSCVFDETTYDCCKIFVAEKTEKGICMVFNSMISEESKKKKLTDPYYPWKIRQSGEGSGLKYTLHYNKTYQRPGSKIPFGINVMVKESDEWSDYQMTVMLPNTQNYMAVQPIITETSKNTKSMSPETRRCLFPNEKSDKYEVIDTLPFNKLNCYSQCQHKNVVNICNCTLPWFFPKIGGNFRECKVSDLSCIYINRDIFSYIKSPNHDDYIQDARRGVTCDCIDSCFSMVFLITLNLNKIPNANATLPIIKGNIFIGSNVITKYGASLEYTLLDLFGSFGGILGLCLGASVLSLAEVLYATIKIVAVLINLKIIKWLFCHGMW